VPTYSYRCRDCEVEFDTQQAFSDPTLTECPECKGTLRKLFSPVGVTFQGSGFYRTDSRADAKKQSGSSAKPAKKKKKEKKSSSSGSGSKKTSS
jgi:putative FmdB family regulatory protein